MHKIRTTPIQLWYADVTQAQPGNPTCDYLFDLKYTIAQRIPISALFHNLF